jgi:hypothetical protein
VPRTVVQSESRVPIGQRPNLVERKAFVTQFPIVFPIMFAGEEPLIEEHPIWIADRFLKRRLPFRRAADQVACQALA